jgi:hypothetical protein
VTISTSDEGTSYYVGVDDVSGTSDAAEALARALHHTNRGPIAWDAIWDEWQRLAIARADETIACLAAAGYAVERVRDVR